MAKDSSLPKNRTTSLLSMAAKLALKESQSFLQGKAEKRLKNFVDQADIVVKHVGKLKGAAMKAVQMLTIEAHDILPPEVLQVLEKLQSQAQPLPNETMMQTLRKELGEDKFKQIKDISPQPIAAASIGQVYSANINNENVVIKIQYPEIAESIDSDLKTLRTLMNSLLFIFGKSIELDDLFSEVARVLKLEANYLREAESIERYRKSFENDSNYLIPKVNLDFTTAKVITLERMPGKEFVPWLNSNPSPEARHRIGNSLLNLYMKELFENKFVQTDPNPANFLVNDEQQLILLDFGAALDYSDQFVTDYHQLIQTVFYGDTEKIQELVISMQFLSPKESHETQMKFSEFLKYSLKPFSDELQPFDFSQSEYTDEVRKKALEFSKLIQYSAPPKQLIFLHRKLGGIFQLLKKMGITADLRPYKQKILQSTAVESSSAQQ